MGSIVVVGGYGAFGSRIVERLARGERYNLIVAGRNLERARTEAARHRAAANVSLSAAIIDAGSATSADLASLGAGVVVNASGPFQEQDYTLARAAIAAGSHYVDIADSRRFVVGISALDAEARRAGVCVISGASSVPGLSSAVVEHYRPQFSQISSIDIGISPGNSFDPGEATTASVLSGIGRPISGWSQGAPATVYGWQGLGRAEIPGLGRRWMSNVDVPDLELFPARIPGVETVRFRAGLEVSLFHLGLYGLSWLARAGLLRHPERLSRTMLSVKHRMRFLGSDRGGMFVNVSGLGNDGKPRTLRWSLVASSGHGPYVPAIGAIVLAQSLSARADTIHGASPCFGHFTPVQFLNACDGLDIHVNEAAV